MLEIKNTTKQTIHSSLTTAIIAVIESSHHKLTCGEIVKAIKQLDPDCNKSSIRRILTRLTSSSKYSIARTEARPYLYYPFKAEQKELIPYELDSFFNPDEPLFIHCIMIMIRDVPVRKDDKFNVPFLELNQPIRFSFYKSTQSIRIDLKCSEWKKALDCNQFRSLIVAIDTVLHLKGIESDHNKMLLSTFHLNQDDEFQRIAGANFVSVQAFENLLLTAYNKKEGIRKEVQLSPVDISIGRVIKQLNTTDRNLGIATVFDKANTLLTQLPIAINQNMNRIEKRTFDLYKYTSKVVQEVDITASRAYKAVEQVGNSLLQVANNQHMLVQQVDQGFEHSHRMLLDHDTSMKKESEFLVEEIQLLKVSRTNQARSDSLQTTILELLKEKNSTLQDLMTVLQLDYNRIYYHIRKLVDSGKITATKEEREGKGARKRIYKLKEGG